MEAEVTALWVTTIGIIISALVTAAYAQPSAKKSGTIAAATVLTVVCLILAVVGTVGWPPASGSAGGQTTTSPARSTTDLPPPAPTVTDLPTAPRVTEPLNSPPPVALESPNQWQLVMEEQYSFPAEWSIKFDIPIQMLPAGMGRPSADLFRQGSDLVGNSRGIGVPTTPVSAVDATTCLSALRAPVRSVRMDDGASGCVRTEAGRVVLFQMTGASIINVRIWEES